MKGGQAGLWIKINRENFVPIQRHFLGKVGGGRGLARSAFEVNHSDDLQMIVIAPTGQIGALFVRTRL